MQKTNEKQKITTHNTQGIAALSDERIERHILGTIIHSFNVLDDAISSGVSADWFYIPGHKHLWDALVEMGEERITEPDAALLVSRLKAKGQLEALGGHVGITDIIAAGGSVAMLNAHLQELRRLWLRREAGLKLEEVRDNPDADLASILDKLREMNAEPVQDGKTLKEYVRQAIDKLEKMLTSGSSITGLKTGFPALDEALGGLNGGTLTVVGARPAMGKSIFGQNVAYNVAEHLRRSNFPQRVLFLSLEMSGVEIVTRLLQQVANLNFRDIVKSGQKTLTGEQMKGYKAASRSLKDLPLVVREVAGMNICRLAHLVESEHHKNPFALVVVDYLQLIKGYSKRAQENPVEQVAEVSQGLKDIAKWLNIPVLALAQVNREAAQSTKKEVPPPTLAQLKGSGAIEQDADAVILLHRPAYYSTEDEADREEMQLILAKNRHGETGTFPARFRGGSFSILPQDNS